MPDTYELSHVFAPLAERIATMPLDEVIRIPEAGAPCRAWFTKQLKRRQKVEPKALICCHRVDGDIVVVRIR